MAQRWSGWLFTLVWSMTGLLQVAAPPCVHHASAARAVVPAQATTLHSADPHVAASSHASHQHALAEAQAATVEQEPEHSGHDAPCDCLTACCAAAVIAWPAAPASPAIGAAFAAAPITMAHLAVDHAGRDHRQPPSTAPPGSRDR